MAPYPIETLFGNAGTYAIYLLIGIAFGAVLEMAGFANTRKLAAQFYLKDMTVLKVMFGAIVTAMVLIFLSSGLGLLEYSRIWVNPTYLWPGIVGGLIMGFGFIIGGFCPGTSLVALATLKVDGMFFALGALTGILLFGETVGMFESFWNSSYLSRFTLPELFDMSTGAVVTLIVLTAIFMFWGAEQLERIFGGQDSTQAPKFRLVGAAALAIVALSLMGVGQPTVMDKWERIAPEKEPLLTERQVQIHPAELAHMMQDDQLNLVMLDLRDETDFNLFHLKDVRHIIPDEVEVLAPEFLTEPANTAFVLIDNGEVRSTEAWKILVAESVQNVYILDGGINRWLTVFGHDGHELCPTEIPADSHRLQHLFNSAIGSKHPAAEPDTEKFELKFTPKLKLEAKRAGAKGGCG